MTEVEKIRAGLDTEDADIEKIAMERLSDDNKKFVSFEEVLKKFNITQKDIDEFEDVELELIGS